MRRIHLFELEDQTWFPAQIRDAGTDFVRFISEVGNPYLPIVSRLKDVLIKTDSRKILDLCSGGGGPLIRIREQLVETGCEVTVTLSDKFPNRPALEYMCQRSGGGIDFLEESVDATAVPTHLSGFRTLFTSFHHFRPLVARGILQDAVDQRRPIGVLEVTERSPVHFVPMLLNPFFVLLVMPFIRPFRLSRLFWTYLIPIVPLYVLWDGAVSCLRTYSPQELQELVDGLDSNDYIWEIGREAAFPRPSITYLLGYPRSKFAPVGGPSSTI